MLQQSFLSEIKTVLNKALLSFKDFDYEIDEAIKINLNPEEEAQKILEQSLFVRMKQRELLSKFKILQAMKKIDKGDYGICETCGEAIPIERLKARPIACECIFCQELKEKVL